MGIREVYIRLIAAFEQVEITPLDRSMIADRFTILACLRAGLDALQRCDDLERRLERARMEQGQKRGRV